MKMLGCVFAFIYQHWSTIYSLTYSFGVFIFVYVQFHAAFGAHTNIHILGQSQTLTHPTIHKIIQSIRMTAFCICAYNGIAHQTPNAIKSIDSVSSPKLKHISYYYVRSFCFMSESIEFMRSICLKKYEWHSSLLHTQSNSIICATLYSSIHMYVVVVLFFRLKASFMSCRTRDASTAAACTQLECTVAPLLSLPPTLLDAENEQCHVI